MIQTEGITDWRPLARRNLLGELNGDAGLKDNSFRNWQLPAAWQTNTFADDGFLYLWNISHTDPLKTWLSDEPTRVRFPYNIIDDETRSEFETKYGGADSIPIFSDPRITPTFHGVGAGVFATDPASGEVLPIGKKFSAWLDRNPQRKWGMMMNYHPGAKIGDAGVGCLKSTGTGSSVRSRAKVSAIFILSQTTEKGHRFCTDSAGIVRRIRAAVIGRQRRQVSRGIRTGISMPIPLPM